MAEDVANPAATAAEPREPARPMAPPAPAPHDAILAREAWGEGPRPTRPPLVPAAVQPAGFLARAVAFLIDDLILGLFMVPLAIAGLAGIRAGMLVLGRPPLLELGDDLTLLVEIGWFAMAALYFTMLHRGAGQTIGKAIVGIAVRSLDLTGIGTFRSALRTLGYLVSSSFLGLGFLIAAVTPNKRAWHDYVAGTRVVHLVSDQG